MDSGRRHRQPSALMVNDDGSTSETYLRRLQHEGYLVTRTADPAEALVLAKQSTPQMIFVNIVRGGSGGSIFLQALRSSDQTRHIPVAILSRYYSRTLEDLGLTQVAIA
jgi:CheY-like chemotaxis protein